MSEEREAEARRIGRLIAELRESCGLTQEDLARLVDVSVSTVSRWERGLHKGEAPNVRELAKAFGVAPAVLHPRPPEVRTQLDKIEDEVNRQGEVLDALVEAIGIRFATGVGAAAIRERLREARRPPAGDRPGQE